jgi:cardiolipin synthase
VLLTLPNLITLARLAMVPATIWLILQQRLDLAFVVFVAAGISDGLDGWLARITGTRSVVGALLDPLADKALLVSSYVTLAAVGVLPDWLAILVVFRDVVIVGGLGLMWTLGQRPEIRPLYISKMNTFAQIALVALVLFTQGFALPMEGLAWAVTWLVAGTTIVSLVAYVGSAARRMRGLG